MKKKIKKYWSNLPPVFYLTAILNPRLNFDGVCKVVNQISLLLARPEDEPGLKITKFDLENDLEPLYRIYYEKYANKNNTTSSSTANVEFNSEVSSASYAMQFLSQKK